jgi:hypothetical protein
MLAGCDLSSAKQNRVELENKLLFSQLSTVSLNKITESWQPSKTSENTT